MEIDYNEVRKTVVNAKRSGLITVNRQDPEPKVKDKPRSTKRTCIWCRSENVSKKAKYCSADCRLWASHQRVVARKADKALKSKDSCTIS